MISIDIPVCRQLASVNLLTAQKYFIETQYAESKSQNTVDNYTINLDFFEKFVGDIPLNDITPPIVREYLIYRAKGHSSSTSHQAYRVLRTFFKWCMNEGYLEVYPMSNIKAPRITKQVIPEYTQDEIHKLIDSCDCRTFLGSRNKALISVLLDTGLRRAEVIGIRLGDFDIRSGVIKVKGKGDKERIVHMEQKARTSVLRYKIMRELKNPKTDVLFLANDLKPLTGPGLTTIIRKMCQHSDVKVYKVVHKLRHTHAIETLRNGGRLDVLKWELGHAAVGTTMKYLTAINDSDAQVDHRISSPGDKWL